MAFGDIIKKYLIQKLSDLTELLMGLVKLFLRLNQDKKNASVFTTLLKTIELIDFIAPSFRSLKLIRFTSAVFCKYIKHIICTFVLFFSVLGQTQLREVPSGWKFIIIKTYHFDVVVNAEQQQLGQIYAQKLEEAYRFLNPYFPDHPEKTLVIINDTTDLTNGYATQLPYPFIMAYPVLSGPHDSLSESDDWPLEFLAHEYTHILTFAPAKGVFKVLRSVFGTVVAPNIFLPRWWKEGLAVEVESQIANGGRLRSKYQDAFIRGLVNEEQFQSYDIAMANEVLPVWPEGLGPYVYGSLVWNQMVSEHGEEIMKTLNIRHGGRMPFFIEAPAREHLGLSYESFYQKTLDKIENLARAQLSVLRKKKPSPLIEIAKNFVYSSFPSFNRDGTYLAFLASDEGGKKEIQVLKRNESQINFEKAEKILGEKTEGKSDTSPSGIIQRIEWFNKRSAILFDKTDNINELEVYSDLHIYDLQHGKSWALSHGLRARDAAISPNDDSIIFVRLTGGKTSLAKMTLTSKSLQTDFKSEKSPLPVEELWDPGMHKRISSPSFLNETQVIFSLRDSGRDSLYIYDLQKKSIRTAIKTNSNFRFPRFKNNTLYFISDQSGVFNLYQNSGIIEDLRFTENNINKNVPQTHLVTGMSTWDIDPRSADLYITLMTGRGPQIAKIQKDDRLNFTNLTDPELPKIDMLLAQSFEKKITPPVLNETSPDKNIIFSTEEYSPWSYLLPRYWIPLLGYSSVSGNLYIGAQTSGFDPLKKHIYNLSVSYDSGTRHTNLDGGYQNNQTDVPILLQSSEHSTYLYQVEEKLKTTSAAFSVLPSIWTLNRHSAFELGYKYNKVQLLDLHTTERSGPFFRLSYSDYSRKGLQISPEEGKAAYLQVIYNVNNSDQLENTQYLGSLNYYFSNILPKHNVVSTKLNAFHTPENIPNYQGALTSGFMPIQDISIPLFVMRGTQTGQFYGKNLYTANLEYRFPILNLFRGAGTDPYFFHRLHGAIIADHLITDGYAYNKNTDVYTKSGLGDIYATYGTELRLETSLLYVIPINFIGGYYWPREANYGSQGVGISLQAGGSF